MHQGSGGKKDEVDLDAERFFRAIVRTVLEQHSRPSGLPLILAALPEHHHLFHQVSHKIHDLLDDLDELVEKLGGKVMVMPKERMPGRTGTAATYRH